MATRRILPNVEPALHKKCRTVTNFDARLHTLLDDMRETLMQADGVGLAAPQVGVLRRAIVVLETDRDGNEIELHGTGLTARCYCHEIDHLNGVVFTDVAERMVTEEELESGSWREDKEE